MHPLLWIWLHVTCVPFYDTYWSIRGSFEFEQMFGRRPLTGIDLSEAQLQLAEELLQEEMQNTPSNATFALSPWNPYSEIASSFAAYP